MAPPLSAQSGLFIRGDVNHDGLHSIADLTTLIHYTQVGSNPPACLDSADLDDNGMINILDVSLMMSLLFFSQSNTAPTPAPFPTPGLDPTDDELSCFGPLGGPDIDDPLGSELPHVFTFFPQDDLDDEGFAMAPGSDFARIPIMLSSNSPYGVEGFTLSFSFDPSIVAEATVDFDGSAPQQYLADIMLSETNPAYPGRLVAYSVMELLAPITSLTFPVAQDQVIGHLNLRLHEDAPVDTSFSVNFSTFPPTPDSPAIRNEVVKESGIGVLHPEVHPIEVPIRATGEIFIRGDYDRDGVVELQDAFSLVQWLFTGVYTYQPPCLDAVDVNDDGRIDIADGMRILQTFYSQDPSLRPATPYPYQGVDRTEDAIPCAESIE